MLHAAGSSPRALDRFATALAIVAGPVVVPPLEWETGASLIGKGPEPFAAAVALTRELLDGGGPGPRLLVGHSMGGLIALMALMDGADVDAAVLYEPITLSLLDPADAADRAAREWDRTCIERFRERCAAGEPEAGVAGFIEAYGEVPWGRIPASARAAFVERASDLLAEASATHAARLDPNRIARISVPLLLLDGDGSPDVARRMVTRLSALLPSAERFTIAGAGHMGPVVAPNSVARAISNFALRRGLISPP